MKNLPSAATLAAVDAAIPVDAGSGLCASQVHARTGRGAVNSTRYALTLLFERGVLYREKRDHRGQPAWHYRRSR